MISRTLFVNSGISGHSTDAGNRAVMGELTIMPSASTNCRNVTRSHRVERDLYSAFQVQCSVKQRALRSKLHHVGAAHAPKLSNHSKVQS